MNITFLGADHEVTGSCTLLEANGRHILIDCGMEQGRDTYQNQPLTVDAKEIDAILLTHAHIDHSGRLPLLYKSGCTANIYATEATADLCAIMLMDSANIQTQEAEWRNRKAKRSGAPEYEPLYTADDAQVCIAAFKGQVYNKKIEILPGVTARFNDVGHLLGSAAIELWVEKNGKKTKLVFSGDVGNINQPILRDPCRIAEADYVMIESTYGDRSHGEAPDYVGELASILNETLERGGNLIIPAFAVGRTQGILYFLREIKEKKLVNRDFTVYVDSPLAVEATNVFRENTAGFVDEEMQALLTRGVNPLDFSGLRLAVTTDESRAINFDDSPHVVLSASGMCDAGRIRHHLKHNLWRPECTVLFVGYQSQGSIGRSLIDGAESIKLFGETVQVRAEIKTLAAISGHADREGLLAWMSGFEKAPRHVFVNHGDDTVCDSFAALLAQKTGFEVSAPYNGEKWDLDECRMLQSGTTTRLDGTDAALHEIHPAQTSAEVDGDAAGQGYLQLSKLWRRLNTLRDSEEAMDENRRAELAKRLEQLCRDFGV